MKVITILTNLLNGTEEEVSLNLDAIEIFIFWVILVSIYEM
jgi:hypothetical protein